MPKKLAVESLELDSLALTRVSVGSNIKLQFNSVAQADSKDVKVVTDRIADEESLRGSKVKSLDTKISNEESLRGSKVKSLDTRVSKEESLRGSKVASLSTRMLEEETTTQIATVDVPTGVDSLEITFASQGMSAFASTPAVAGMMRYTGSDATAPIIVPMMVGTANANTVTFNFSDATTGDNGDYKLDIIATD